MKEPARNWHKVKGVIMGKTYNMTFETLGDYLGFLKDNNSPWQPENRSTLRDKGDWSGGATLDEAFNMAEVSGWPEGTRNLSKELDGMKALNTVGTAPAIDYDVAGFMPDVPRAITGLPDCMINHGVSVAKVKPIIKMVVSSEAASNIKPQTIIWRGAAILSFVDSLEQNGYSVEIVMFNKSRGHSGTEIKSSVQIKRAGEPMELDRMAYCLTHPSFLRKLGFRYMEAFDTESEFRSGYGRPGGMTDKDKEELRGTIYFEKIEDNYSKPHQALKDVKETIEKALSGEPKPDETEDDESEGWL
jgi:hypothetical protein